MMTGTRHYKKDTNEMVPSILVKRREGFTLLEVMIALVILSVGLLGLAGLQLVAVKGNSFSTEMTYATMLAQQHAETLKNLPYTDANLAPADEGNPHTAIGNSKGVQYAVSWTVTDNTPATDMKTVNLTVQWTSLRQGTSSEAGTVTARLRTIIRNQS
jgi:type IV pilus assembly protein PilV